MTDRKPEQVDFAAQPVRPRRRRIDPVFVGIAVVVVSIGLLVVKPWQEPATVDLPAASAGVPTVLASDAVTGPSEAPVGAVPSAGIPQTGTPSLDLAVDWERLAATVMTPHDAWGVRTIVRTMGSEASAHASGLAERWIAVRSDGTTAGVPSGQHSVVALGMTFPFDDTPLDVRVLQAVEGGTWRWLDAPLVPGTPEVGGFLFGPPVVDGRQLDAWPTGDYELAVLWHGTIGLIDLPLTGRFERFPFAAVDPPADPPLKSPMTDFASLRPGAFVVSDGIAFHLDGRGSESGLDAAGSWLAPDGSAESPGRVARLHAPRANGLGILAPVGATKLDATIRRTFPVPAERVEAERLRGTEITGLDIQAPYAVFRPASGRPFPAGSYEIDASWTVDDRRVHQVFDLELRPGLDPVPNHLVTAERQTARDAGRVVLVGPTFAQRVALTADPNGDLFSDRGCAALPPGSDTSSTRIVVVKPRASVEGLTATLDFVPGTGQRDPVPLLVSRDPIHGSLLLVPNVDGGLATGAYRLTLRSDGHERLGMLCIGPRVSY